MKGSQSSGKKSRDLVFKSCTKREMKEVSNCSRTVTAKKCQESVTHLQSYCFGYRCRCFRRRRCQSSLLAEFLRKSETDKWSRHKFGV